MKKSLFIQQIWQKDNFTLSIKWNDDIIQNFRLCDLQRHCSCANCTDEVTGEPLLNSQSVKDDVRAIVIRSVGRYGLQIQFTSGCSMGIYDFDRLRNLQKHGNV